MIANNLRVLLAERSLTITRISSDTGISRTTITSLVQGEAQGIQFVTVDALCRYLKISPGDFFVYAPYDVEIKGISSGSRLRMTIHGMANSVEVGLKINWKIAYDRLPGNHLYDACELLGKSNEQDTRIFVELINRIPTVLQLQLMNKIEEVLFKHYERTFQVTKKDSESLSIHWRILDGEY